MYRTHTTHLSPHLTRSLLNHFSGESYFSIKFSPLMLRISKKKNLMANVLVGQILFFQYLLSEKTLLRKKNCQYFLLASQYFLLAQKRSFFKSGLKKKTANESQPWPTLAIAYISPGSKTAKFRSKKSISDFYPAVLGISYEIIPKNGPHLKNMGQTELNLKNMGLLI